MKGIDLIKEAERVLRDRFAEIDETAYYNQKKVLHAFQKFKVREENFNTTSGYGYGDLGRDRLEDIYAEIFKAEDAMVRGQIVSGTHAITACLFGVLRPGDELVSILGTPYDTLANVIGRASSARGTLVERGIKYKEIPLQENGHADYSEIINTVNPDTKMVLLQRSRGYSLRPSLGIEDIRKVISTVRQVSTGTIIFVDNCYGEFTDIREPVELGADLIAGSLIKNPGGGLAPSGGYIAGKKELVEDVSYHLTAPGLGKELGASLYDNRMFYQGLYLAPHVVAQATKSACLIAYLFSMAGYDVYPQWSESRGDIVQVIKMNSAKEVLNFCQIIQQSSPVDSDVNLEYADLPGYTDEVVMAAGTFIQGSSIEISCDAPMRKPYCAFLQGGLTYEHCRYVAEELVNRIIIKE